MKLKLREAAEILNVPEGAVLRWIREKGLPAHRMGEQYSFHRIELLEWATSRGIRTSPGILRASESASSAGLADVLSRGGIAYGLKGSDRKGALRAVVEALPLPSGSNRDLLLEVLLAREDLGTTALGDGIAIPHVRSPIVVRVEAAAVFLSFLENGVDFGAPDGKPVSILFTLLTPTVQAHLHLLSRLAGALQDPAFKGLLARQAPREEILAEVRRLDAAANGNGGKGA